MKKTNKKLFVIMAIIALLLCSLTITSKAADPKYFTISSTSGNVGQKVTVEIKAKVDLNVEDANLDITYDSTKLSATADDVKLASWLEGNTNNIPNLNAGCGVPSAGHITFGFFATDAFQVSAGSLIGTIDFTILNGAVGNNTVTMEVDYWDTESKTDTVVSTVTGIQPVTEITLDQTSGTVNVGDTVNLVATVLPTNATSRDVTWTTSDATIATVENGRVTAVKPGTTTITAKAGDKTATYTITVKAPLTGITLSPTTKTILKNQSTTLTVSYEPTYTTDSKTVVWTSSDETVAKVENGVVKGIKEGTATITATVGSFSKTCVIKVQEIALNTIAIDQTDFEITVDETKQLNIIYNPENTTDNKTVVWKSSDETIATVENGVVKGIKEGTATITATVNGKEATVKVTVKAKPVEEEKEEVKEENKEEVKEENKEEVKEESKTENKVNDAGVPHTGDIAIILVVALMIASAAGIIFMVRKNRK